jgi:hypothetical protein
MNKLAPAMAHTEGFGHSIGDSPRESHKRLIVGVSSVIEGYSWAVNAVEGVVNNHLYVIVPANVKSAYYGAGD